MSLGRRCTQILSCRARSVVRWLSVVALWTILMFYYIDNDGSLWTIPHLGYLSDTETPYVDRFPARDFGPNKVKVILVWTKYFGHDWNENIQTHLEKSCPNMCVVTKDRSMLDDSDALLFHFTDKDLIKRDMPPRRQRHQVWALFINEPNPSIQESFTPWTYIFNWTVSYRQHSTVFTPYGYVKERPEVKQEDVKSDVISDFARRDKMAYAVVSKCADDAQRYKLIDAIKKIVSVDLYGYCGNKSCEIADDSCMSKSTLARYKFRLSFEDSNCRDYVTEKYWTSVNSDIIPVVDWKIRQMSPSVIPESFINVNDFDSIENLTRYVIEVGNNEELFKSYFKWKKKYEVYDEYLDSFCNFCKALYDKEKPAQIYRDLEGWLRDDTCKRFTYQRLYRRYIDRFLYDGNTADILGAWKKRSGGSS